MNLFSWVTFFTIRDIDVFMESKKEDERGPVIFAIVVLSVCLSLGGVLIVRGFPHVQQAIMFTAVGLSWVLLHTIFALHYARLFYADDKLPTLVFPNDDKPDYLDFAYFSFVIGMTFQVSDVVTNTKHIRRIVLLHSLISFVFNTVIVALTIGVLASF